MILPFFHEKPIHYRYTDDRDFEIGALDVTVNPDGSCHIQISTTSSKIGGAASGALALDSDMVDKISWDGEKFMAIFERNPSA